MEVSQTCAAADRPACGRDEGGNSVIDTSSGTRNSVLRSATGRPVRGLWPSRDSGPTSPAVGVQVGVMVGVGVEGGGSPVGLGVWVDVGSGALVGSGGGAGHDFSALT